MSGTVTQDKANELIMQSNLLDIMRKYGNATIVGSYRMQVMTWNDLDFYVDLVDFKAENYYGLVAELITQLKPIRYDGIFNMEQHKYFVGLEILHNGERWNLDIWWKTYREIEDSLAYADELMSRMEGQPKLREAVIGIKQELIKHRLYGFDKNKKHYHSNEIYDAVFNKKILDFEEFVKQG